MKLQLINIHTVTSIINVGQSPRNNVVMIIHSLHLNNCKYHIRKDLNHNSQISKIISKQICILFNKTTWPFSVIAKRLYKYRPDYEV